MTRALLLVLLLGACVHYKAAPVDMEATVLDAPKPPEGALPYEEAVEWAVLHNPDLLALRKRGDRLEERPRQRPRPRRRRAPLEVARGVGVEEDVEVRDRRVRERRPLPRGEPSDLRRGMPQRLLQE